MVGDVLRGWNENRIGNLHEVVLLGHLEDAFIALQAHLDRCDEIFHFVVLVGTKHGRVCDRVNLAASVRPTGDACIRQVLIELSGLEWVGTRGRYQFPSLLVLGKCDLHHCGFQVLPHLEDRLELSAEEVKHFSFLDIDSVISQID
jgi:hypothetical protein